jgi:hypothetical protein
MGFNPRADWVHATSPIPRVTLRLEQLKEARIQARDAMIKAQQSWVKHRDTPKYKEGDQVWLEGKNLRINQPTAKLAPRRHGPFKIVQVMSAVNYRLELPTQWSIHPVFHIDLLTPYKETIMHGPNFTRPTPELIDGEEEYTVEKILDSRHFGRRRRLQYLVKWEGYPDADNMWVDKDDVFADDKVREFKASNPDSATHIRSTLVAKSPHPPTSVLSHLLQQHASSYMSSDGHDDLAAEYPAGAIADSPIPFSQEYPVNTPVTVPIPIVDFTTMQPLSAVAPVFSPRPVTASSSASDVATMFRQLRVHTPAPLTPDGQRAADQVLRSVDRSVRLGRLGVCPECLMAEVGKRLDYNGVHITERWINTQGESACQALKGKGRKGLYKVFQPKRMRCRDSTKYAQRGCIGEVAEALQSIQLGPSDTRSQSYRLLAKLSCHGFP